MSESSLRPLVIKYVYGFVSALLLSGLGYIMVVGNWFHSNLATMGALLLLAVVQLVIQLVCFLHLGVHKRSFNRTVSIVFTLAMMLVIVIGSVWVMRNLDYRMGMSSEEMNDYMLEQNKKGF